MYRCIPESNLLSHICLLSTPPPLPSHGWRPFQIVPKVHSTHFSCYYPLLKQVYLVNLKILGGTCRMHHTKFVSIYNLNIYIATIYLIPIFSLIYLQNSNPQFIQTQVAYIQNSSTPGPTVMFTQQLNCSHPSSISKPQIQILIAPNAQNPLTTSQA